MAVPRQGTISAVKVTTQGAAVVRTAEVTDPWHELALTVLDRSALVVDRGGRDLVVATDGGTRRFAAPVPPAEALVPERTHGTLAAVTLPAAGAVLTLGDVPTTGPIRSFPLRDPVQEPVVPFSGRVYVPVRGAGQVRAFAPSERQTGVLWVALGEFTGPVWPPDGTYRPTGANLRPPDDTPSGPHLLHSTSPSRICRVTGCSFPEFPGG
jgi:hypothetical protein